MRIVADLPNRTTARPLPTFGGVEPVIPLRAAPGGPGSAESDRGGGETRTLARLLEGSLVAAVLTA
jgi:hypothetical protein